MRRRLLILGVVVSVTAAAVGGGWLLWHPRSDPGDLAAILRTVPDVPGGKLYQESTSNTGCSWTDCREARVARTYLVSCDQQESVVTALDSALISRGFLPARPWVSDEDPITEWDSGFIEAEVTSHKIWATFGTDPAGDYTDEGSSVSPADVAAGCSIYLVLSVSKAG